MKAKELRSESNAKSQELVYTLEEQLFHLRNARATKDNQVKSDELRKKRKTIARIHTILTERKRAEFVASA